MTFIGKELLCLTNNGYVHSEIVIGDLALEIARRILLHTGYRIRAETRLKDDFANDRYEGEFIERVKEIVIEELKRRFA